MAVKLGVAGSAGSLGEGRATKEASVFDRLVTGRMVEPLPNDNGEFGDDIGDRGVRGLRDDSGFNASALCDAGFLSPRLKLDVARSKFGTLACLDGILDLGYSAHRCRPMRCNSIVQRRCLDQRRDTRISPRPRELLPQTPGTRYGCGKIRRDLNQDLDQSVNEHIQHSRRGWCLGEAKKDYPRASPTTQGPSKVRFGNHTEVRS